ncbi:hypothetical protein EDB84DRAFT_576786 [Lactarius hengduanensis]|nr:hypothetical protein EDB84DRAFT_576786 [Lactarius hengduanensis]
MGEEKKNCWACHYCNTESRLLLFSPHALCEARRFPSRKKCSIATSTTGLCVSNVVNFSSFFSVGRPTSRFGENGQRKRKIARFPCDRHPIEIGGTSSPMARPLPAPLGMVCCCWNGGGGRGTLKSEKKNLGLVLYWCRSGRSDHRVPAVLPLFCVLLVPCSETSDPPFDGFPERAENEKKKAHLSLSTSNIAFVWTNSGVGSSIDRLLRCY